MDKASSLMFTAVYLSKKESEAGIKYVPFNEIPERSTDASLIDFVP